MEWQMDYPNLDRVHMRYLGNGSECYQLQLCDNFGNDNYQLDKEKIEAAEGLDVLRLLLREVGLVPMLMEYDDQHGGPCVIIDGVLFTGEQTAPVVAEYKAWENEPNEPEGV